MALPTNLSTVWVRGTFINLDDGSPMSGQVIFTLNASCLVDVAAKVIIANRAYIVPLDSAGSFAVQLFVTDDPDATPTNLRYLVQEPTGRSYEIAVPSTTPALVSPGDPLNGQQVIDLTAAVAL